jgi:hypothetical protein
VAVVTSGLVEVVVTQLVEDNLFQVIDVKLGVHQGVDINVTIIEVVAPTGGPQAGIEKYPVGKGTVKILQRPLFS